MLQTLRFTTHYRPSGIFVQVTWLCVTRESSCPWRKEEGVKARWRGKILVVHFRRVRRFGGRFDELFPACIFFFFFLLGRDQLARKSRSDHSGSASGNDCGRASPEELSVNSFPCEVPTPRLDEHSQPTLPLLGQGCTRV